MDIDILSRDGAPTRGGIHIDGSLSIRPAGEVNIVVRFERGRRLWMVEIVVQGVDTVPLEVVMMWRWFQRLQLYRHLFLVVLLLGELDLSGDEVTNGHENHSHRLEAGIRRMEGYPEV